MKVHKARRRTLPKGFVLCPRCDNAVVADTRCRVCAEPIDLATVKKGKAPRREIEGKDQEALFERIEREGPTLPEDVRRDLEALHHSPNGGARNGREAAALKRQGTKAGYLDLTLDVARGGYFGLRIELKPTKEAAGTLRRPSIAQEWWLQRLTENGYRALVVYGADAAWDELMRYCSLPYTRAMPQ